MENRYLLLVTLIIGLSGQTVRAMLPLQIHQRWALRLLTTETLLKEQVNKYHPGFTLVWYTSNTWGAKKDAIGVPISFIANPIKEDISTSHHEWSHIKGKHLEIEDRYIEQKNKRTFSSFLLYLIGRRSDEKKDQNFNELCKKHEREADEAIPNNPEMLRRQMNFYKLVSNSDTLLEARAVYEKSEAYKNQLSHSDPRHPSFEERATRFEERYNKLTKHHTDMRFYNPKVRQFFGVPLTITGTSPRKAAKVLGLDQDYYPNLSIDMSLRPASSRLHLFKPTKLAQYSFSRNNEFLKPRVVSAVE